MSKRLKWVKFTQVIRLFNTLFIFICTFNLVKMKFPDFILSLLNGFIHLFDFIPSQSDNPRFYEKLTFQKHDSLLDVLGVFAPDQTPGIFEPGFFGNGSLHQFVVVFLFKFLSEHIDNSWWLKWKSIQNLTNYFIGWEWTRTAII